MKLDPKVPEGPIQEKWDKHRFNMKLVNPSNKRKFKVLIVGTGLAGASAAASMAELGYNVELLLITIAHAELIVLQLRVELMQQRIIPMTVTVFGDSFMTLSRVAISALAKQMFIAWRKSVIILLTNVLPKVFILHVITAD